MKKRIFDQTIEVIREKLLYMFLFGAIFTLMGYFIPRIYFEYYDRTVYWKVIGQVRTDKNVYQAGERVHIFFVRESNITQKSTLISELLCADNELYTTVDTYARENFIVSQGIGEVNIYLDLPSSEVLSQRMHKDQGQAVCYYDRVVAFEAGKVKRLYQYKTEQFVVEWR